MNLPREPCANCRRFHGGKATSRCFQYVTPDGATWMPMTDCCFKNYVRTLLSIVSGNGLAGAEYEAMTP